MYRSAVGLRPAPTDADTDSDANADSRRQTRPRDSVGDRTNRIAADRDAHVAGVPHNARPGWVMAFKLSLTEDRGELRPD